MQGGCGQHRSSLKQLKWAGCTGSNRLRDSKSKIVDVAYVIYAPHLMGTDQPCEDELDTACADTENSDMDNPYPGNRT